MQQVSSKKMTHREAKQYRDELRDAVMYQHRNGDVYVLADPSGVRFFAIEDKPYYVTTDSNQLLIGDGARLARAVLHRQKQLNYDIP